MRHQQYMCIIERDTVGATISSSSSHYCFKQLHCAQAKSPSQVEATTPPEPIQLPMCWELPAPDHSALMQLGS
jgi:hypothetical protein